jgi:hypothetical protein
VQEIGQTPVGLKQVIPDQSGTFWAIARGGIGRLILSGNQVKFDLAIPEERNIKLMQIVDEMLYYPAGTEVHAVPIASLKQS